MNEAIINKALAAFVPALLLDLQGNILHANERAAGLVQLSGGQKEHYNRLIGEQVGISWKSLLKMAESGADTYVFMLSASVCVRWQLLPADERYVLIGTDVSASRVFDNFPIGMQHFTPDGVHVRINSKQKEIWGTLHADVAQPGYNLLEHGDSALGQLFTQVLLSGEPAKKDVLLQYREEAKDDVIRLLPVWYEATIFPTKRASGEISDMYLMLNDVSEQRLAAAAMVKSERMLDNIIEHLPIGYIQFDQHGFARRINHRQRQYFKSPELAGTYNVMNDPFAKRYGLDALFAYVMEENKMVRVEKQMDFSLETVWTNLDSDVWLELTFCPIQDPIDKKQVVVVLLNDITERRLEPYRRSELQRNVAQLHYFFDAVDMGYATMETDGRLHFANSKAKEMAGYEIVPGNNIFAAIPEFAAKTPFSARWAAALKRHVSESFSSYFPRMDKWYDFLITPMRDGTVSVFIRDITESRKMHKELRRANSQLSKLNRSLTNQNQQLEDFAHITSHNLRAPIANLRALMQMHNEAKQQDEKNVYLSMVQEVTRKIDETLNDLVDVVQIRKNADVEKEWLSFAERLQYVKEVLLVDIEKSGIELVADLAEPLVLFPRIYLDSILQNLITNAIRYRSPDRRPQLHFKSWKENGMLLFTAADNGLGIDLARFGSKLFGFRKTFHRNKDAKGIGLFIIKTQIDAMGGSIRAESTPGQGTKFIITFKIE